MKCDTCHRTILAVPVDGCGEHTACPFAVDPEATLPPLLPDVPLHTLPADTACRWNCRGFCVGRCGSGSA